MTTPTRPFQRRGLGAALAALEATDPDVAEAAEALDTRAWKASVGWPEPRNVPKSTKEEGR